MKHLTITSLILISLSGSAEELGLSAGAKNELIISASTCDILLKQESALCDWKKKVDPAFNIPKILSKTCLPAGKGKVKLTISNCLPEFAKNYHAKKLVHDGPNCWGTAMSFNKLSTHPRFMWPEEMMYWMNNSPLCRKLTSAEQPVPGDIINVFAPEKMSASERLERDAGSAFWDALYPERFTIATQEIGGHEYTGFQRLLHSVTFVSDKLAFGKDSPARSDRFYFHPMEEVYGRPSGDAENDCKENQNLEPYIREYQKTPKKIKGTKCSYFSVAYRCENFNDYFAKQKLNAENESTWKSVQSLKALQEKLFPLLTSTGKVLEDSEVALIITLADITLKRVTEDLKISSQDKNREMLLTQEYFAAAGIRQTLEQVNLIRPLHP